MLRIDAPAESSWEVTVRQHLSVIEEWQWKEMTETAAKRPRQPWAVWTGRSGPDAYELVFPTGRCRVVCTNVEGNPVEFSVREKISGQYEMLCTSRRRESWDGWIHRPGTYIVRADAWSSEWKIEVFNE